ncbi:TPA: hypothetical protein ACH3X2_011703 [Trebouxia sp. C0005]
MQGGLSLQTCHIQCVRPCAFGRRVQQNCMRLHKRPVRASSAKANGKADVFTLLLDCDGVLVDTEAQGHRVSFNEAFKQKGLDFEWSVDAYGNLLAIGGGKERMSHYFTAHSHLEPFSSMQSMEDRQAYVKDMHLLKTELFMKLIEKGQLPLRPGVQRIIDEAIEAGAKGLCWRHCCSQEARPGHLPSCSTRAGC